MSVLSSTSSLYSEKKLFSRNQLKVLWPEWTDFEYNSFRLDIYNKEKPIVEKYLYTETDNFLLPDILQSKVVGWLRSYDYFKDYSDMILYEEYDTYKLPNLYELNRHLMCSPLMRLILSSFGILQYFGDRYSNKMPQFFNSPSPIQWRPWFHLYTYGKIKKDAPMDATWNANGICIARLYYGGSWVLMRLDDYIPIDKQGRALLPLIASADKGSNIAILWPLFLTKALLKIAALTWSKHEEVVDFSPIYCITGWIYEKIDVRVIDKKLKWDLCRPYAATYTWPEDDVENSAKRRKNKSKSKSLSPVSTPIDKQMFLCVLLKDMTFSDYGMTALGPCYGHLCYVEQTRDCILEKPEKMPELESWKRFRWLEWAREHHLYPPDPFAESAHSLEILSTFRRSMANSVAETEVNPPPSRATTNGKSSKKSKESGPPQILSPLFWCSFDHIYSYILELHIFFIPGAFHTNWMVVLKADDKKVKSKSASPTVTSGKSEDKKSRKSAATTIISNITDEEKYVEVFPWSNELSISKNTPVYLFIDSLSKKFLLISLQHKCVKYMFPKSSTTEPNVTTLRKSNNYRSKASIVIEKYTFENYEFGEVEFFMNTMGVSSKSITIPPGRYIYRLWLKSEAPCNLILLSNTSYTLSKVIPIHELMTNIPLRLQEYANSFSNSFSTYFNAIGYEDFKNSMHAFYRLIHPDLGQCNKKMKIALNETIVNILYDMCELCESPKDMKCAMFVLFGPKLSDNLIEEYSVENSAARKIQALFKGFYVRRILEKRYVDSKQYDFIQNLLRDFYDTFFNIEHRNLTVPRILLALIKQNRIYNYSFYADYMYYIKTYECRNQQRAKVDANSWAPLLMCKFFVLKSIWLRFELQTELSTQIIRVFDNDTGKELPRYLDICKPQMFNVNNLGYTIIAYGWNLDTTDISDNVWILQIAHLITEDLNANILKCEFKDCQKTQVEGIYIPNEANIVCGCFVRIKSNNTVVIRVGTSYELAKINVQLILDNGTLVYELAGLHGVVSPPLNLKQIIVNPKTSIVSNQVKSPTVSSENILEFAQLTKNESLDNFEPYKDIVERPQVSPERTKQREVRYYLKVNVLDDSWPCSSSEWHGIQEYKNSKLLKSGIEGSGTTRSVISKKIVSKGLPTWTVHIMSSDPLTLQQDNEKEIRILRLKSNWERANPGRFIIANKLRQQILQEYKRPSKPEDEDSFEKKPFTLPKSNALKAPTKVYPAVYSPKSTDDRTLIPKWRNREERLLNWKDYKSTSHVYKFIKNLLLEQNKHIMTTDKHWLKTPEDEKYRHIFREYRVQDFQKRYRMLNNYMQYLLNDYAKRFGSVYDDLEENMIVSENLNAEAYDTRKYIYDMEKSKNPFL